jgi:hypothetical protein
MYGTRLACWDFSQQITPAQTNTSTLHQTQIWVLNKHVQIAGAYIAAALDIVRIVMNSFQGSIENPTKVSMT